MNNTTPQNISELKQEGQDLVTRHYIATRIKHHLAPLVENGIIDLDDTNGSVYSGWSYDGRTEVTISAETITIKTVANYAEGDVVERDETHDLLGESLWYYKHSELETYLATPVDFMYQIDCLCQWKARKLKLAILGDS